MCEEKRAGSPARTRFCGMHKCYNSDCVDESKVPNGFCHEHGCLIPECKKSKGEPPVELCAEHYIEQLEQKGKDRDEELERLKRQNEEELTRVKEESEEQVKRIEREKEEEVSRAQSEKDGMKLIKYEEGEESNKTIVPGTSIQKEGNQSKQPASDHQPNPWDSTAPGDILRLLISALTQGPSLLSGDPQAGQPIGNMPSFLRSANHSIPTQAPRVNRAGNADQEELSRRITRFRRSRTLSLPEGRILEESGEEGEGIKK